MQYNTHLLRHTRFTIGQNIQRHRASQQLPLQKLARLCGISEWLLDHYELGKNEMGVADLVKIACALRVTLEELVAQ